MAILGMVFEKAHQGLESLKKVNSREKWETYRTLELNSFSYDQRRGKPWEALMGSSYTGQSFWPREGERPYCWTLGHCPN